MQNPERILIDGSSYLYRAFHAMPPLMNSKYNYIHCNLYDYEPWIIFMFIYDEKS